MAIETPPAPVATVPRAEPQPRAKGGRRWPRMVVLFAGAILFLFPFYYMLIGSLQTEPNTGLSGLLPDPGNWTLHNYEQIDGAISLGRTLINSGVFTGGVLLGTVVFGLLAGYALAVLEFRGKRAVFASVLLILVVPFQLLTVPLYVLIVRDYGLADTYLGMILPFAINSTAVFVFRQFFLQLPKELFEAARIDGAGELSILWRIAIPLCKPALITAVLLTFIGPWNEFLWPFLVTKEQSMQPLAVSLANYISTVSARAANPFGAILAGACVLAAPAVALFVAFQKKFVSTQLGSGVKG
jgi:ABC-type glycerol-3-phosphate transport system permease component